MMNSGCPLIGLYTAALPALRAVVPLRLRALAAEAALQGAGLTVFSTAELDLAQGAIQGWRMTPEGWRQEASRLPDVVMNPVPSADDFQRSVQEKLRAHVRFTTQSLGNKLAVAAFLARTELSSVIPPFQKLQAEGLAEQMRAFLSAHPRTVLKPANGRQGNQVYFLHRTEGGLGVRRQQTERVVTVEEFASELEPNLASTPWIMQAFIASPARGGRVFDVRVHVHKDISGSWTVVRSYVRLSEEGLLVSNTSRGGYQGDVNHFFAGLGEAGRELTARLDRLGLEVARRIDERAGGGLDELGVDLLVDPQRRPWVIEVNTHPQSRYHEFERARYAIEYARHLAALGPRRAATPTDAHVESEQ